MPNRSKADRSQRAAYREELAEFQKWICFNHYRNEDDILHNFSLRDVMLEAARENDLDGFCFQTFSSIPNEFHSFLNFGCSLIADAGYPVAPESDLYGAVSSVLIEAASSGDEPSFLPEPTIRHPTNDNAVLLWHGHAPLSLRAPHSAGQGGHAVDSEGLANRRHAFQTEGRSAYVLPFCGRQRRLSPRLRRRTHRRRPLHAGVLHLDGG